MPTTFGLEYVTGELSLVSLAELLLFEETKLQLAKMRQKVQNTVTNLSFLVIFLFNISFANRSNYAKIFRNVHKKFRQTNDTILT